ncbi:lipid II flippase MurJ, partial [Kineococcus glutinatus]|uniref:lipid II flippase MurJ n=1 Tax=Kineococcus glutinatus TaxID=1070872 RepID=UPI0031EDA668
MRSPRTLAAAVASVAAITVLARIAGFGRTFALSKTVGDNCLGAVYTTANLVPNVLFEVVAGGMLAGALVPVLAPALAAGTAEGRERASRTASAVLTWTVLVLAVAAALTALLAGPVTRLLLGGAAADCAGAAAAAEAMLLVFLPQVPLYGLAVVLGGALQAQRRFTASAAAPLVSSLVVTAAYLGFAVLLPAGVARHASPDAVPPGALAVLSWGTTAGVLAMVVTHVPALRSQIRWRPALRPAPGDGTRLRGLALAGLAVLLAQQAVTLATARLSNAGGDEGAVVRWSFAWALFLLPYAVLAVPVAMAVFPRLAAAAGREDPGVAPLVAGTSRAVVLAGSAVPAALPGAATPVALVFVLGGPGSGRSADLAGALVVFAPALLGYGLTALLVRALYAVGRGRAAAGAAVTGWAVVLLAALVLTRLLPPGRVVTALAAAHAIGLTVGALLLARAVRAACGPPAVAGLARASGAGALAAL